MKKKPAKKKLGMGNRRNPWQPVEPMASDHQAIAMTALRFAQRALLHVARIEGTPGICHVCGCTDNAGCDPPCRWVDARHTCCSRCRAPDARTARRA
jgi:hypothetical protein